MHLYTKFGCKKLINSRDVEETVVGFFRLWPCTVTLTLKIGTRAFHMTLRVTMMHHHTKLGCTQFSGSEDIFETTV